LPNGDREAVLYAGPVNYFDSHAGAYEAIDATLVDASAQGYAYTNRANSYSLLLPSDLSSPVRVERGADWVSFALQGARGALQVDGANATYVGALDGVDVRYAAGNGGAKETMVLRDVAAPSKFVFGVQTTPGLTLRTNANGTVDVIGEKGEVAASLAAPTITDSAGVEGPIGMSLDPESKTVTVTADKAWLNAPDRAFPVTIDPTVTFSGSGATTDCILSEAATNSSFCTPTVLNVGYDGIARRRSILQFPTARSTIPYDSVVLSALLQGYVTAKTTSNTVQINARRITRSWTSAATWNKWDGVSNWTTAGGDFDTTSAQYTGVGYQVTGLGGATGVTVNWAMTKLVQDWVNGVDADKAACCCGNRPRPSIRSSASPRRSTRPILRRSPS
jgi:hypothetical protein